MSEVLGESYTLDDLRYLMSRLRDPDTGCPWDLQQNYKSIVPFTLEETYELADAIESQDISQIRQELGDVLFQVVFYSQLAEEAGDFSWAEVVHDITAKLVRRHPHVFPTGKLRDEQTLAIEIAEVKENWEQIKAAERAEKSQYSLMDDIPKALPAVNRAIKLQKRAARIGFDWPNSNAVFEKIEEEIAELKVEIANNDAARIDAELGDVLLAVTNLARKLGVDPEASLRAANRRFEGRFRHMEQSQALSDRSLADMSAAELELLWLKAKQAER